MPRANRPRIGDRVFGYAGNGAVRFAGVYQGKRKEGSGWAIRTLHLVELSDGDLYETMMPLYREETD